MDDNYKFDAIKVSELMWMDMFTRSEVTINKTNKVVHHLVYTSMVRSICHLLLGRLHLSTRLIDRVEIKFVVQTVTWLISGLLIIEIRLKNGLCVPATDRPCYGCIAAAARNKKKPNQINLRHPGKRHVCCRLNNKIIRKLSFVSLQFFFYVDRLEFELSSIQGRPLI